MTIIKYASAITIALALTLGAIPAATNAASAPTCVFNTIVQPTNNGGTTLSWKVNNAHTVNISGIGNVSKADAVVVYPSAPTTYVLKATGKYGTDTCSVVALPTANYSFGNNSMFLPSGQTCSMWVNPDAVVAGGTAVLSWRAHGADVSIDRGIGNVSDAGNRVIPNTGVPQTFTMTAKWGNGVTKNCSATVIPVGGIIAPTFSGTTLPTVTASYVAINQVPYTGTSEVLYVLALLTVALGAFTLLYTRRGDFISALNGDFEKAVSNAVIHEA